jgi:hypothetical protein
MDFKDWYNDKYPVDTLLDDATPLPATLAAAWDAAIAEAIRAVRTYRLPQAQNKEWDAQNRAFDVVIRHLQAMI